MTSEEAIARTRAKWAHPPVDPRDVEERIAIRFADDDLMPTYRVEALAPAVRIFRAIGDGEWTSVYIHHWRETDGAIAQLEMRALNALAKRKSA